MSEFNLATADKWHLKDYALNTYELGLSLSMNEETMRDRITEHCKKNNLEAPFAEIEIKRQADRKEKWAVINIAKTDKHDGSEPVFVGIQGVGYTIPRGIDVKVPEKVVHILNNAVKDIVTQDPDTGELYHNPVLTYAFQIVKAAA